ncbi:MAG: hypothetical protein E7143_08045 [Rikenellaceae bacterium]|nr:hypothetical protein [Rikenellaceae bacterium]
MAYQHLLVMALKELERATKNYLKSEQIEAAGKTIGTCAIIAAGSSIVGTIFPGASLVANAAWVAAIWGMYIKINKDLGISIKENALKSLASALLTNILATAGAYLAALIAAAAISFIPGLHLLATPVSVMLGYMTVYAAGLLYIKLLTKLFKANGSFDFSESGARGLAASVVGEVDMNDILDEARASFKQDKKDGNIK